MPTERLSTRSGSTRFTTFPTVQLGMANTSGILAVQHNPTILTSNDTPLPRTSRRACKDLALARLLSTVDLDDGRERSQKRSSTTTANTKRPVRSALTSCSLDSPRYRRSRVAASKSDVDEDSHHKMESSNESISSDDTSETPTSEESSPSDSSESDFFEDWIKRRPSRRPRKCQPKTPKKPPPRTEACSAMRVTKPPNSLLPKRTFSVPARKHTGIMTSANTVVVGESLPGREQEFDSIYTFISGKLLQGTGGCMYISGLPGTGKTASVNAVLAAMTDVRDQRATFQKITVNGMQVNDPKQVYAQILQQLTGQLLPAKQAAQQLEREFCSSGLSQSHREKSNLPPVVLVIDELDLLCTRRQDVLYNLFDWPTRPRGRRSLIVLAIANTMDLPERLLHPRVASRLGLTRLTFAPYSHEQLVHIVQSRLIGSGSSSFQEKALELAARKVAAVSGDVRRALDICRRAAEMVPQSKSKKEIGIEHINAALKEMFTTPKLCAIQACSLYEKLFLRALIAEFQARSTEEARLDRCILQMCALCRLEGFPCPTTSEVFDICSSLGAHKLLLTEPSRRDTSMLVRLNCSKSDVLFALKPRSSA